MGNQAFQASYEEGFVDKYEFIKSDGLIHQAVDLNNNTSRLTQSLNTTPVRSTLKSQSVGFAKRQTKSETFSDGTCVADDIKPNTSQSVKSVFFFSFYF
jgi:hypothetical protein